MSKTKPLSKPKKSTKNRSRGERTQGVQSSSKDFYEDTKVASFTNDTKSNTKPTSTLTEATENDNKPSPVTSSVSLSGGMSLKDLVIDLITKTQQNHAQVMDKTESIANKSIKRMMIINSRMIKLTDTADLISEKIDELLISGRNEKAAKTSKNTSGGMGGAGGSVFDWLLGGAGSIGMMEYIRRKLKKPTKVKPGTKVKPTVKTTKAKPSVATKAGKAVKAKVGSVKSAIKNTVTTKVDSVKNSIKATTDKIKAVKNIKVGKTVKAVTTSVATKAKGLGGKALGFLGKIVAPAVAAYEGVTGYNEGEEIYGKNVTFEQKRLSAESKILDTLTFGLIGRDKILDWVSDNSDVGRRLNAKSEPAKAILNADIHAKKTMSSNDKPMPEKISSNNTFTADGNVAQMMKVTDESEAIVVDGRRYTFKQLIDAGYLKPNSMFNEKGNMFEKFSYMRNLDNWHVLGGLPEFIRMGSSGKLPQLEKSGKSDGMMATMMAMIGSLFGLGNDGVTPDYSPNAGSSYDPSKTYKPGKQLDISTLGKFTTGDQALLETIAHGEGTSDVKAKKKGYDSGYDVTYGYNIHDPYKKKVTEMTIGEVRNFQAGMLKNQRGKKGIKSSAIGKYQFIRGTFNEVVTQMGLSDDTIFDKATQDAMILHRLKTMRKMDDWKAGKISDTKFMHNLSQEFASWADPERGGRSHYGQHTGTGLNTGYKALEYAKTNTVPAGSKVPFAKADGIVTVQATEPILDPKYRNEDGTYTPEGIQRNKKEYEARQKTVVSNTTQTVSPTSSVPEKIMEIPQIVDSANDSMTKMMTKLFGELKSKLDTLSEDFNRGNGNILSAIQGVNGTVVSTARKSKENTDYFKNKRNGNTAEFDNFVAGSPSKG